MTFEEWFKKYVPPSLWGSRKLFEEAWNEGWDVGFRIGHDRAREMVASLWKRLDADSTGNKSTGL